MAKYIGRFVAPLALGAAVTLGACKADSSKQDTASALNRDTSALGRDLAMANRDSTAQPQLNPVLLVNRRRGFPLPIERRPDCFAIGDRHSVGCISR